MSQTIVSSDWLKDHLMDPDLRILDASYHLPTANRNPDLEFVERHIAGAIRFDIEKISDPDSNLPHMLPSAELFDAMMQDLGIGKKDQVVVYDSVGLFSAARAWWMFRYFGHARVVVLDGGLPVWLRASGATESGEGQLRRSSHAFQSQVREVAVIDADGLSHNLAKSQVLVLDARSAGRFQGVEPEPRPGMRSGHIPGSVNSPFKMLLDSEARRLLPKETLTEIFKTAGVDRQPLVVTCGSGVTACVLALGLEICGLPAPKLFDGSWSEWAIREDLPVEMD